MEVAGAAHLSAGGRDLSTATSGRACPSGRGQVHAPLAERLEDGDTVRPAASPLPLNEPEARNAIHGCVSTSAWTPREREHGRVVLEHLLHPQPGYPFRSPQHRIRAPDAGSGHDAGDQCRPGAARTVRRTSVSDPRDADGDSVLLTAPAARCCNGRPRATKGRSRWTALTTTSAAESDRARALDHCFTDLERDGGCPRRDALPDGARAGGLDGQAYGYVMLFTGDPLPDATAQHRRRAMTCPPNAFARRALIRLERQLVHHTWGISPRRGRDLRSLRCRRGARGSELARARPRRSGAGAFFETAHQNRAPDVVWRSCSAS